MKKLTKRVQAGGLWFDVPSITEYISADKSGEVFCWKDKPITDDLIWSEHNDDDLICKISDVDIGGANWRYCCWYVGDQVDGEAVESREWMARGADAVVEHFISLYRTSDIPWLPDASNIARHVANSVRAGEIE